MTQATLSVYDSFGQIQSKPAQLGVCRHFIDSRHVRPGVTGYLNRRFLGCHIFL